MPKSSMQATQIQQLSWQQQLSQAITDPLELLDYLQLSTDHFPQNQLACDDFKLKLPHSYAQKMQPGNAQDPLLLQVMSQHKELLDVKGYNADPVGDLNASAIPGLLHKYHGRVLLITTGACAVHCRYCFRRHFPYGEQHVVTQDAIDYITQHVEISEVILSGGDPLLISDKKLADILQQLSSISHVKRLRIHSRLPVVLPARITTNLLNIFQSSALQICMVIHANHHHEIDDAELTALAQLSKANVRLLNQSVLLAGINDRADILCQLSERLFEAGVLPYYLHQLDPVSGAAHFEVSDKQALHLIEQMRQQLPGYLVPRLVREIADETSKTPLFGL